MKSKKNRRSRRPKNVQSKKEASFFSKTNDTDNNPIQKKEENSFFQKKSDGLTIGKPGDKYEKEADQTAENVVNKTENSPMLKEEETVGSVQRYMTNSEEDELGTNTERIEKDKYIQEQAMEGEKEPPEGQMQEEEEAPEGQMQEEEETPEGQMQEEEEAPEGQMQEEEEMPEGQMQEEEEAPEGQMQEEEEMPEGQMQEEEEAPEGQMQEEEEMPEGQMKEEEEMPMGQEKEEEEPSTIQQKSETGAKPASPKVMNTLDNRKGKGRKMSGKTKSEMEKGFGADFGDVNIHTDKNAAELNKELHSQAFTHGEDIYFNEGKFNPDTNAGKRLLAHELTHVVQQKGGKNNLQKEEQGAGTPSPAAKAAPPIRKNIVFIMGDLSDPFYDHANKYFQQTQPGADFVTGVRTLSGVLAHLNGLGKNVRAGNLYLVTHGASDGTLSMAMDANDKNTTTQYDELDNTLKSNSTLPSVSDQIDGQSKIYIKGCNVGQSGDMVTLIDKAFGTNGQVIASTHETRYQTDAGVTQESLTGPYVERPGTKKFKQPEIQSIVDARYGHLPKAERKRLARGLYQNQKIESTNILTEGPTAIPGNSKKAVVYFQPHVDSQGITLIKLISGPQRQGDAFVFTFDIVNSDGSKGTMSMQIGVGSSVDLIRDAKKGEPDIAKYDWRFDSSYKNGVYRADVYMERVYSHLRHQSLDAPGGTPFNPAVNAGDFYTISN